MPVFEWQQEARKQQDACHELIIANKLYAWLKTNLAKGFVSSAVQQQAPCLVLPGTDQQQPLGSGIPFLHAVADAFRYAFNQPQLESRWKAYPKSVDRSRSTRRRGCRSQRARLSNGSCLRTIRICQSYPASS